MRVFFGLAFLLLLLVAQVNAADFRFVHNDATTGLSNRVYTESGRGRTIHFTEDSNAESGAILDALVGKYIFGTVGIETRDGVKWQQGIIISGEFTSKIKIEEVTHEKYRDFRLTGVKVIFPLARLVDAPGVDSIDPPMVMEIYFSFASLFPHAIVMDGKIIDLSKHARKRGIFQ